MWPFKKKEKVKIYYNNIYDLATSERDKFIKEHDMDDYTKKVIKMIENDIKTYSKQGLDSLEYYNEHVDIRVNIDNVIKYFKDLGFNVKKGTIFRACGYQTKNCINLEIDWKEKK